MKHHLSWSWVKTRPIVIINLTFLLLATSIFIFLLTRPIDVLEGWEVSTTKQNVNGSLPTYYPGGTLEFISKSEKLISAVGETTRIFDCDATGSQAARQIVLSPTTANRSPGVIAARENSIIVPSVGEFNGLPRTCRIVFNVCYENVILWRDHCETARTNDFLILEESLDPQAIRLQITELNNRIEELEKMLAQTPTTTEPSYTSEPTEQTTQNNTTTNNDEPVTDDGFQLHDLPLVGGLLNGTGL